MQEATEAVRWPLLAHASVCSAFAATFGTPKPDSMAACVPVHWPSPLARSLLHVTINYLKKINGHKGLSTEDRNQKQQS